MGKRSIWIESSSNGHLKWWILCKKCSFWIPHTRKYWTNKGQIWELCLSKTFLEWRWGPQTSTFWSYSRACSSFLWELLWMQSCAKSYIIYKRPPLAAITSDEVNRALCSLPHIEYKWKPCDAKMFRSSRPMRTRILHKSSYWKCNIILIQYRKLSLHAYGCRVIQKYLEKLHNEITAREDQLRWGCEKSQE